MPKGGAWLVGDRYDGEFRDGEEDGLGVFTWADGSTYDGFWQQGRKHGLGVYRPAPENRRLGVSTLSSDGAGLPLLSHRTAKPPSCEVPKTMC